MTDETASAIPYDSVDVVVLRMENGRAVPVMGGGHIDLSADHPPPPALLAELMQSMVRVRADEGYEPAVLDELRAIAVPPTFAASPWLTRCRPVVVEDGIGQVGRLTARYSDFSGLRIDDPESNYDHDDQDG